VSDNQTSFKSSSRELKDFYLLFVENQKTIEQEFNRTDLSEPVEWTFIPPGAPHQGGAWEIMVKAMKRAMKAISSGQAMTEDTFSTFLCQAMNLINCRPLLKHYSNDVAHYLTPNCFLTGKMDTTLVPPVQDPPDTKLGARWRQLEQLTNELWHRFIKEILPELSPRVKWKSEFNNLTPNTVVLVVEQGLPRGVWKMGLVTEVLPGRDGFARKVKVKIGSTIFERSVTSLIPLLD